MKGLLYQSHVRYGRNVVVEYHVEEALHTAVCALAVSSSQRNIVRDAYGKALSAFSTSPLLHVSFEGSKNCLSVGIAYGIGISIGKRRRPPEHPQQKHSTLLHLEGVGGSKALRGDGSTRDFPYLWLDSRTYSQNNATQRYRPVINLIQGA